ncbi:hypothetical protein [Pseudooceanicola sp. 200-1SW]|uniref:hypothetical protein n=1 Tax=Pseudooceanicola sp. 200-1SW TaxID=3425949 RepID=UPI003D7F7118
MKKVLFAFLVSAIVLPQSSSAESLEDVENSLETARHLYGDYEFDKADRILWDIFLEGEASGASTLQIAKAADLLANQHGPHDHKEYLYLLTWASEAGYPKSMGRLAREVLYTYRTSKSGDDLIEKLLMYPKFFSKDSALSLLKDAAQRKDPDSMRAIAGFYSSGSNGFLLDPRKAQELETEALAREVEIGSTEDFRILIKAARENLKAGGDASTSNRMVYEAIKFGYSQPLGIDADTAYSIAAYYRVYYTENRADAINGEYRWRLYGLKSQGEFNRAYRLEQLGDFFSGGTSYSSQNETSPIDITIAHAIYNYAGTLSPNPSLREKRDSATKKMSTEQVSAAMDIARHCTERGFILCLDAIDHVYSK